MDNQTSINRVEEEWHQWQDREARFSKLFSSAMTSNKEFMKEKLQHFDRIIIKYGSTQNLNEKFALRMLKMERRQLERQLYPNLLFRLLRRFLVVPAMKIVLERQNVHQVEKNNKDLQSALQRAGFGGLEKEVAEKCNQGLDKFSIPVSYYINEKEKMDHVLSFAKDETGQYQLEGFKAALHNYARPDEYKEHYFDLKNSISVNSNEAQNLLAGRSVNQDDKWIQLDFNDKDQQGSYRIKQFHENYGYDLENVIKQLPIKALKNKWELDQIMDKLKNGENHRVSFVKDGIEKTYNIEANPQFKTVNIFDEHSRKVTLATAAGTKTAEAVSTASKIDELQNENKRNSMRIT